jgi:UDP:flavonoid glycosyltransferase YjiC (YdhE family)
VKILLVAEGATAAHVGRPLVLAQALQREGGFEPVLARPASCRWMTDASDVTCQDLDCQAPAVFAERLAKGAPLYDLATLASYVEADRALIRQWRPDVVVGDFRLSLSVSARLERVPYATICDAYWSPEADTRMPVPVLPWTRFVPPSLSQRLFDLAAPIATRLHALPMHRLRRRFGLATLGLDLRRSYTDADLRLFASLPGLFPAVRSSGSAAFIGPLGWSPQIAAPADIDEPGDRVYVTMGSSGDVRALDAVLEALGGLSLPAMVATAGRGGADHKRWTRARFFDFLPGDRMAAASRFVVCNGGSPTVQQALMAGVPVLGIPSNMDQMLNMRAVVEAGCGVSVRADHCTVGAVRAAAQRLILQHASFTAAVRRVAGQPSAPPGPLLRQLAAGLRVDADATA